MNKFIKVEISEDIFYKVKKKVSKNIDKPLSGKMVIELALKEFLKDK